MVVYFARSVFVWKKPPDRRMKAPEKDLYTLEEKLTRKDRAYCSIAKAAKEREQDIRDTLMNHKRETLMQHGAVSFKVVVSRALSSSLVKSSVSS